MGLTQSQVPNAAGYPIQADESIMSQKGHGTCVAAVMSPLRWGCDEAVADNICCYNRHYAEFSGYWEQTKFLTEANTTETTFYDSVTGKPLFIAPRGRSFDAFKRESQSHGYVPKNSS